MVLPRWSSWILVLARGDGLRLLARERPRRSVDGELLEAHFGVADELRGLILRLLVEPAGPAATALIRGHRWIEVGAVALLVVAGAPLSLFKTRSACN
jgi:hypothetical protein